MSQRDGWTQPCCEECWRVYSYMEFGRWVPPVRFREGMRQKENCVFCLRKTESGIYIRVDPSVPLREEEVT